MAKVLGRGNSGWQLSFGVIVSTAPKQVMRKIVAAVARKRASFVDSASAQQACFTRPNDIAVHIPGPDWKGSILPQL